MSFTIYIPPRVRSDLYFGNQKSGTQNLVGPKGNLSIESIGFLVCIKNIRPE